MSPEYGPQPEETSTPDRMSTAVTPSHMMGGDHSFTLQAIMELQKSNGQLSSSVDAMKTIVEKTDCRMEKLEDKLSVVTHRIYAAGVVLAIAIVIGGFLLNKAWNMMENMLTVSISASQTSQTPPPKPTLSPKK